MVRFFTAARVIICYGFKITLFNHIADKRGDRKSPCVYQGWGKLLTIGEVLELYANDVTSVVEEIGKPFVIVGQSMGGRLQNGIPNKSCGMVLLAPVSLFGPALNRSYLEKVVPREGRS